MADKFSTAIGWLFKGVPRGALVLLLAIAVWWAILGFPVHAAIYSVQAPPAKYLYEPESYRIIEMDAKLIHAVCPRPGQVVLGCAVGRKIFIVEHLPGETYRAVLAHEKAHVNGWRHYPL